MNNKENRVNFVIISNIPFVFVKDNIWHLHSLLTDTEIFISSFYLKTNLAIADLLMGVYMLIIAYQNTIWDGIYYKHDISWRASDLCIFAGVVSTVSSEVSVLTLTVTTFDRLICIVFPFRFQRMSLKKAVVTMIFVWLLGLAIAITPLLHDAYFHDFDRNVHFYGRSAVCLPFHLSAEKIPGWEYSVSIFLALNSVSFIFILAAYLVMYRTITKAGNAVRSTRLKQDSTIAKRMMFIILTDFFCWFPVIVISILSLTGHFDDPKGAAYAWIAVFVLPINSSLNPLLYTFSTPLVRETVSKKNRYKSTISQSHYGQGIYFMKNEIKSNQMGQEGLGGDGFRDGIECDGVE